MLNPGNTTTQVPPRSAQRLYRAYCVHCGPPCLYIVTILTLILHVLSVTMFYNLVKCTAILVALFSIEYMMVFVSLLRLLIMNFPP